MKNRSLLGGLIKDIKSSSPAGARYQINREGQAIYRPNESENKTFSPTKTAVSEDKLNVFLFDFKRNQSLIINSITYPLFLEWLEWLEHADTEEELLSPLQQQAKRLLPLKIDARKSDAGNYGEIFLLFLQHTLSLSEETVIALVNNYVQGFGADTFNSTITPFYDALHANEMKVAKQAQGDAVFYRCYATSQNEIYARASNYEFQITRDEEKKPIEGLPKTTMPATGLVKINQRGEIELQAYGGNLAMVETVLNRRRKNEPIELRPGTAVAFAEHIVTTTQNETKEHAQDFAEARSRLDASLKQQLRYSQNPILQDIAVLFRNLHDIKNLREIRVDVLASDLNKLADFLDNTIKSATDEPPVTTIVAHYYSLLLHSEQTAINNEIKKIINPSPLPIKQKLRNIIFNHFDKINRYQPYRFGVLKAGRQLLAELPKAVAKSSVEALEACIDKHSNHLNNIANRQALHQKLHNRPEYSQYLKLISVVKVHFNHALSKLQTELRNLENPRWYNRINIFSDPIENSLRMFRLKTRIECIKNFIAKLENIEHVPNQFLYKVSDFIQKDSDEALVVELRLIIKNTLHTKDPVRKLSELGFALADKSDNSKFWKRKSNTTSLLDDTFNKQLQEIRKSPDNYDLGFITALRKTPGLAKDFDKDLENAHQVANNVYSEFNI